MNFMMISRLSLLITVLIPFSTLAEDSLRILPEGITLSNTAARQQLVVERFREGVAAGNAATGSDRGSPNHDHSAADTRALRAEIRSGQRGNRLVRGVRLENDDQAVDRRVSIFRPLSGD